MRFAMGGGNDAKGNWCGIAGSFCRKQAGTLQLVQYIIRNTAVRLATLRIKSGSSLNSSIYIGVVT
jgi:hypothetical protein